jgi:hypothetical protein
MWRLLQSGRFAVQFRNAKRENAENRDLQMRARLELDTPGVQGEYGEMVFMRVAAQKTKTAVRRVATQSRG